MPVKIVSTAIGAICCGLLSCASVAAQDVGVSAAVNQSARGIRPGAAIRTIVLGDNVVYNERIETDRIGLLQILLADGTTFTVGPNSALSIDRFVYDPAAGTAEVTASLTKGVFRFIGGKTSKTQGGVQLNTPVGTIGIRGAMVDMSIGRQSGSVTTHLDLKYGKELTLSQVGSDTQRVFEAGYSIVISTGSDGRQTRSIQRTPPAFVNQVQRALSGGPGTNGGAREQPTNASVVLSRIATENSDRPPVFNRPPVPTARPDNGTEPETVETNVYREASNDLIREQLRETAEVAPPPAVEPPLPRTMPARIITAGALYTTVSGQRIANPGAYGLIGGSPETDVSGRLTLSADGLTATATTDQGTIVIPLLAASGFSALPISSASGATLNGVPLTGVAYVDNEGFATYALSIDGDRTRPVYLLVGTPTANLEVLTDGDIRRYAYTPDFLQQIAVPFMSSEAIGSDYQTADITDFYVLEGDANGTASPLVFQSWLSIRGQGPSQVSAVGVNVGDISTVPGSADAFLGRRGSYRADPFAEAFTLFGGIASLGGAEGGNAIFGSNGQNLVLLNDFAHNEQFNDDASTTSSDPFATLHVLGLAEETSAPQFIADRGTSRDLAGRTINGFSAALEEGVGVSGAKLLLRSTSGSDPSMTRLSFDGPSHAVGAEITVSSGGTRDQYAFGMGINGNSAPGSSVYIDDDLFAAAENTSTSRIFLSDIDSNGNADDVYPRVEGQISNSYLVSGDAVSQSELLPARNGIAAGKMCECDFLEWGWWGSQVRGAASDGSAPDQEAVRASVHLGTWVAGNLSTPGDLAGIGIASASYNGRALGNVAMDMNGGEAKYLASGDMQLNWNFNASTGSMAISNFDGRSFGGTMSATNLNGNATFDGTLSESGQGAGGFVNGAFVNGNVIAEGVVGNFHLATQNNDWSAVGIIAGSR